MSPLGEDLIDISEAARLIGVHRTTLRDWIIKDLKSIATKIKCPPYCIIGRRYKFRRRDIEEFIKECWIN